MHRSGGTKVDGGNDVGVVGGGVESVSENRLSHHKNKFPKQFR